MKAAINTKYGRPEVVSVQERPKPVAGKNQILLRVHASTVNRTDCGFRSAQYFVSRFFSGLWKPKFHVLGCEFAGVVEAVGEDVKSVQVGEKLFGFNDSHFGAHAEYLLLDAQDAFARIPENCSFSEAAALSEGGHYALTNIRAAQVKAGDKTLVNGATGAIGSAAVQLLKARGAEVTAVCAGPHHQKLLERGADFVVDYTEVDFTQTERRFDFIFDAVGKSSFSACQKILKPKGIYVSTELGTYGANIFLALASPLLGGKKVLFPIPTTTKEDIEYLRQLFINRQYQPLIDRSYPLEEIVEAYRYVERGEKIGNVILNIHS